MVAAIILVAEIGDFRRFASPRQLMAWLGLCRVNAPPEPAVARSPRPATAALDVC
jgi:transposase